MNKKEGERGCDTFMNKDFLILSNDDLLKKRIEKWVIHNNLDVSLSLENPSLVLLLGTNGQNVLQIRQKYKHSFFVVISEEETMFPCDVVILVQDNNVEVSARQLLYSRYGNKRREFHNNNENTNSL